MRGFSPPINIFLTCLAGLALVPVLGLPWFAGAMDTDNGNQGQIELMAEAIGRWFTGAGSTATGTEVLGGLEIALLGVAVVTVLLAVLMLAPPLRMSLRAIVKVLPIAAPVLVLVAIVAEAGASGTEPRYGAFLALAVTAFMASCAHQAGDMRERKAAPRSYTPGAGRAF